MPLNARKNESRIFYRGERKNAVNGLKMPLNRKPRIKPRKPNAKKGRKRAESVPKTDETEQRHGKTAGNTAKPSSKPHERRNDGAGETLKLFVKYLFPEKLQRGRKMQLYANIINYTPIKRIQDTIILYTGQQYYIYTMRKAFYTLQG
jgi:hypothetical protein